MRVVLLYFCLAIQSHTILDYGICVCLTTVNALDVYLKEAIFECADVEHFDFETLLFKKKSLTIAKKNQRQQVTKKTI